MSILIKGMEMPTTCGNCPVHKLWPEDDEAQCMINRTLWTKYSKRNQNCPLVPVPPHGDLIDKQYAYQNTMAMGEHMRKIILKQIDLLPTIIPAEEGE